MKIVESMVITIKILYIGKISWTIRHDHRTKKTVENPEQIVKIFHKNDLKIEENVKML